MQELVRRRDEREAREAADRCAVEGERRAAIARQRAARRDDKEPVATLAGPSHAVRGACNARAPPADSVARAKRETDKEASQARLRARAAEKRANEADAAEREAERLRLLAIGDAIVAGGA